MSSYSVSRSSFRIATTSATANFFASCAKLLRTTIFFRHHRTSTRRPGDVNAPVDNSRAQGGLLVAEHTGPKVRAASPNLHLASRSRGANSGALRFSQGRGHFSLGGPAQCPLQSESDRVAARQRNDA